MANVEAALDEGDSNADAKRKLKAAISAAAAVAAMRTARLSREKGTLGGGDPAIAAAMVGLPPGSRHDRPGPR